LNFKVHYSAKTPAGLRMLNVPHQRRSTFVRRAFSVAGPSVWNSLPHYLRDPAV